MKKKKNEIEIERIYSVNINHYCAGTDGLYMWQKAGPPKPEISYDAYLMMLSNGLPDVALRTPHRDTQRTPSLLIATPFLRILPQWPNLKDGRHGSTQTVNRVAAPICQSCNNEMAWSRSALVAAEKAMLHVFIRDRCAGITETMTPLKAPNE